MAPAHNHAALSPGPTLIRRWGLVGQAQALRLTRTERLRVPWREALATRLTAVARRPLLVSHILDAVPARDERCMRSGFALLQRRRLRRFALASQLRKESHDGAPFQANLRPLRSVSYDTTIPARYGRSRVAAPRGPSS